MGVDMEDTDVSFRCNIVTLSEEECSYEDRTMVDHSSGEISTEDAAILVESLKEGLKREGYEFYAGTGYRHLLIKKEGEVTELTPPHDILGKRIGDYLPKDGILREMMERSYDILVNHPLNIKRREEGKRAANSAWFWGAGKRPSLPSFEEMHGKKGVMISAVDLLKGIAVGAGMERIIVEGANGGIHTNYVGKAQAAVKALTEDGYDFAYIHVEAPDEMGHQGVAENKMKAIENVDEKVLGTVVEELKEAGEDFRLLLLPDHQTPIEVRTHTGEAVPYLLYDSAVVKEGKDCYNEKTAAQTGNYKPEGHRLLRRLLQEEPC